MTGQSKIELILEIKNKIKSGLTKAKDMIKSDVREMSRQVDGFRRNVEEKLSGVRMAFVKNLRGIATEFPIVAKGLYLLSNPIALASGGLLLLTKGFERFTAKAADFRTKFRELTSLNIDKSAADFKTLRDLVLNTAFAKGFDPYLTSSAFFDVQSTTGKYGSEVAAIVSKQGEFAKLMQADFNEYIAGTSKAMANWGFGAKGLDDYNRSAFATMKVGVTTFDQLAKVQSVYAGAAASAKQTYDTANKIFALFTVKTKSVDEAATLTKSMFNDLTKASTLEAFKNVGIQVTDNNGKLKQADELLLALNDKFLKLKDDRAIIQLKNQFSGSEGLIALIQAATDRSGQLQSTLSGFDQTKFGLNDALRQAKDDINYINDMLRNKIATTEIKIGEAMLPLKSKLLDFQLNTVEGLDWMLKSDDERKKDVIGKNIAWIKEKYSDYLSGLDQLTEAEFNKRIDVLSKMANGHYQSFLAETDKYRNAPFYQYDPVTAFSGSEAKLKFKDNQNNYQRFISYGFNKGLRDLINEMTHGFYNPSAKKEDGGEGANPTGSSASLGSGVSSVTGAAQQTRNITVNIDAFNKGGINTQNTTLQKMDERQIEQWFNDMCMRAVRNLELSN